MLQFSLKATNFKCFGGGPHGFEKFTPITLIVGRNNSGKSALLDLLQFGCQPAEIAAAQWHGRTRPVVSTAFRLTAEQVANIFSSGTRSAGIEHKTDFLYGQQLIDGSVEIEISPSGNQVLSISPSMGTLRNDTRESFYRLIVKHTPPPFSGRRFVRLLANRAILAEPDEGSLDIQPNGSRATNVIQNFINKAHLPSDVIEVDFLRELNAIFEPDARFTRIVVQQIDQGRWEVYLEEAGKGRIPLSQSGSGLQTIILVLALLHLTPRLSDLVASDFWFGFEELENNLHPALQRRLMSYLRAFAVDRRTYIVCTTHSSAAIDMFAGDPEAQILHVRHIGSRSSVSTVSTHFQRGSVIDDLDVRASDILQANAIVWVEGPSDRLYFNRWVTLLSNGSVNEGIHYQCVFYGGKLLAHLSGDDPEAQPDDAVQLLRVNRHALILIDSDKRQAADSVNKTKARISEEIEGIGGVAWITQPREIEHYIPQAALVAVYPSVSVKQIGLYEDFEDYLDNLQTGEGKRWTRNKVAFAGKIVPHITAVAMSSAFDLTERVGRALETIRRWNRMPPDVVAPDS